LNWIPLKESGEKPLSVIRDTVDVFVPTVNVLEVELNVNDVIVCAV
jgi:hypothetical protein